MLLVKTRVDKSPIHGLGLFSVEPITKGTPIWRFTPGLGLDLDPATVDSQPALFREALLHYGYIDPRLNRYILCCDDARFINHSDTPNIRSDFFQDRYGVDVATREIDVGEELTINYEALSYQHDGSVRPGEGDRKGSETCGMSGWSFYGLPGVRFTVH